MELIKQLVDTLNIDESQAQGGAGLIFKMAKDKLGSGDFSSLASAVPNIESLISQAPESSGAMGALGGLLSSFGGGKLGALTELAGGFSELKMDKSMITKFLPIVMQFVEQQGGAGVKQMLEKFLK